ncbi:hypothetical protein N9L92_05470, partial [Saprospiraceae bacterium]|nr:hypothetical protein [Saprospiraceae bacterium]
NGVAQPNITAVGTVTYTIPAAGLTNVDVVLTGVDIPDCVTTLSQVVNLDCTCDPLAVSAAADPIDVCPDDSTVLTATLGDVEQGAFIDYIENTTCATAFNDISATGTALIPPLTDDGEVGIMTANMYPFFDGITNEFTIGTNGGMVVGTMTGNVFQTTFPSAVPSIYPFGDDLDTDFGQIYWEEIGTQLIVQWTEIPHFPGTGDTDGANFQIIFDSATGEITFVYGDVIFASDALTTNDFGASASIGINGGSFSNTGDFIQSSNNDGALLMSTTCINYSPNFAANTPCAFVGWVTDLNDISGSTVGTTNPLTVTPTMTTTYFAVVNCSSGAVCSDAVTVTVDCVNCMDATPTITLSNNCIDMPTGSCAYMLNTAAGSTATPQDPMGATQNEVNGFMGATFVVDVVLDNGCMQTFDVLKPPCNCNAAFELNFMASDPCVCNNDQSANGAGDGTFAETVVVTGTCGFNLQVAPGAMPASLVGMMFTSAPSMSSPGDCDYSIMFDHVDLVGYDICVEDEFGTPVVDAMGNQICISNVCAYPVINEPMLGPFCVSDPATSPLDGLIMEVNGNPGMTTVNIDGTPNNTFDPMALGAGSFEVMFNFTGSGTSNSGGTVAMPAFPGCMTSFTATVVVEDGPPVALCNTAITVVADAATGCAMIDAADIDNGSNDPTACMISTLEIDITQICCTDPNPTTVTLTATNTAGVTATCTTQVTLDVSMVNAPIASCADITVAIGFDGCAPTITPEQVNGGSTTLCGAVELTNVSPSQFCCDDIGGQTVTLTVTDPVTGQIASCVSNVTVQESIAPLLICSSDITLELDPGLCGEFSTQQPLAVSDNCNEVTVVQTAGPDFFDLTMGPQIVTFLATDANGNTSECSYTVVYEEFQNGLSNLSCNDAVNVTANADCEVEFNADMMLEGGPYGCYDNFIVTPELQFRGDGLSEFMVTVTDPT